MNKASYEIARIPKAFLIREIPTLAPGSFLSFCSSIVGRIGKILGG
jgi:hypothetical protein